MCELCVKKLSGKSALTDHTLIYLGLMPYKCKFCNVSFAQRAWLRRHNLVHFPELDFKCNLCGQRFKTIHVGQLEFHIYCAATQDFQQCGMCDQQSLRSDCAKPLLVSLEYSMSFKLLTEHHLEFLNLTGRCTGSSEPTPVKMPHCWKSHATAQLYRHTGKAAFGCDTRGRNF